MTIPIYDSLVYYATPPHSYIGATIFLSYIVLALYATLGITYSLYTQYTQIYSTPSKDVNLTSARAARARHIKIYAFLASISFATLSYHMLFFLITHYTRWSGRPLSEASGALVGTWMLESSLFQDFAAELVRDRANAVWTQVAILGTWFWNLWIARKARIRKLDSAKMWKFILLSQILPISFTVCLFLIQLHCASPDVQEKKKIEEQPATKWNPIASLHLPSILLNACLLAQPSLRGHEIFSTLLFLERFILLLPHTGKITLRSADIDKSMFVSAGFIVASQMMGGRKNIKFGSEVKALYDGGFAVKALGWDAVLGAVVWLCVTWGGGV